MKTSKRASVPFQLLLGVLLPLLLVLLAPATRGAVTILQSSSSTAIAWEAEQHGTFINDPLVAETFAALEAEYIRQWRAAPEAGQREAIWLLLQNLETFRGMFAAYISGGKFAVAERNRIAEAKKQESAL